MTRTVEIAATRCANCPLRTLPIFKDRSPAVEYMQALKSGELTVEPGAPIIMERHDSPHLYTMLTGWAFRFRTLSDGRRQIVNYVLPGDFIGLQAVMSDSMTHGVEALTDSVLCLFPRNKFWSFFADNTQIAYDVTWLAAREESTLEEHILSLGRRTAIERLAYLLWYLFDKARGVGLVDGKKLFLPVSQQHLADTLGLSLVHTNKTLQRLREMGSIHFDERQFRVVDEVSLKALGHIEDDRPGSRPLL